MLSENVGEVNWDKYQELVEKLGDSWNAHIYALRYSTSNPNINLLRSNLARTDHQDKEQGWLELIQDIVVDNDVDVEASATALSILNDMENEWNHYGGYTLLQASELCYEQPEVIKKIPGGWWVVKRVKGLINKYKKIVKERDEN